ncbi:MAG: hypothetical protein J6Q65_05495 [Lentisphaeria bacterium]|nr:hypothetical protein [Lentisphaeria bacterium]
MIRQPKRTTWNVEGKISADSLAAQLAEAAENPDGTRILWTPQTVSGSLALTRIPCVILSADDSLLIFLETTGKPEGPFGSRLILMSAEDWSVIKIVDLPDRYLKKLAFVPGTLKIAALCAAQKECKQVAGVLCLDLQSGKEDRFQQTETGIGERTFLVDSNRNLIVSHPKRAELLVLPLESQQNHVIKVAAADAVAALSPDGKEIAVIGPAHAGQIEIFRTTDWMPAATVSVEKTTRVAKIQFLRGNKAFLLCGDPAFSANSVIVRPGNTIELDGLASGMALTPGNGKKIYHLTGNNNEIQELDSSSGMLYRTILTDRAEPRFARPGPGPGTVQHFFYIPFCNGLAMLDSNGNFFLIPADRTENYKGKNDERAVIFQCKGL